MRIIVTGGAGFIGSALVRYLIDETSHEVLVLDKLTYAGNLSSVDGRIDGDRCRFVQADILDTAVVGDLLRDYRPDAIIHLAAESHVDRSIDGPGDFINTNVVGTFSLLQCARAYYESGAVNDRAGFRFHHVSTDEVFGSLPPTGSFTETSSYDPRSPYSASKAASDHLVRAWGHTYGLPVLITNCSNNYGPYQYPEKLIPLIIAKAIDGEPIPVYGDGQNVRDWLYVDDHVRALCRVLEAGRPLETYNIGGAAERTNIDVVETVCAHLDRLLPARSGRSYRELITFVQDRPGHDRRYAIDSSKITAELGWAPQHTFEQGIERTVIWYLENKGWWEDIVKRRQATRRIGVKHAS